MAKIQDTDRLYAFLRPYVDWMFRRSYRCTQCIGRENIPSDGAVIFAPNHTNGLCDALAVLGIDRNRKVFVARADIFRNPKIAKILRWLKIMPISRARDGLDEVRRNGDTFLAAVDTLRDEVPFCILPEGTHRPKHSLLPLTKGIFRIALQANDAFGAEKPVYIVPIGIEYGDYFHLWNDLTINIGKPINVTEFCHEHDSLERPQLILALREELTLRMRKLILWLPDDEYYDENIASLLANPPAPFDRFKQPKPHRFMLTVMLILLLPLFLLSASLTIPLWVALPLIRRRIKDPAFQNSVQYVWQLLLLPLTLFVRLPFWMFFQEYVYQFRRLQAASRS